MKLQENISRIKEVMGLTESERQIFDMQDLYDKGIIFITQGHNLKTGERIEPKLDPQTGEMYDDSTNLITLYNIKYPVEGEQDFIDIALQNPRPDQVAWWQENQRSLKDGKYKQILKSIKIYNDEKRKEGLNENRILIYEETSNGFDAVLVGGLDYRSGDYPISQQIELLKKGLGSDKKIKGFRFNTPSSDIVNFISQNPNVAVFLFSAGATKASDIASSGLVDPNKIFVIEPYAKSPKTRSIVSSAVSQGVPAKNIFVGGNQSRGMGIVNGSSDSQSNSHWGALESVGSMSKGVDTTTSTFEKQLPSSPITIDKPEDVKDFQTWLDKNHSGWHQKYGNLNDDLFKGWGKFGPNTRRAWANQAWKKEYLSK